MIENETWNEVLPTYRTPDGYQCKTKTAIVRHVLEQIRNGKKHAFISIKGSTSKNHEAAKALCKTFLEKRVPAVLHGKWNVIVEPAMSLRHAIELAGLDA